MKYHVKGTVQLYYEHTETDTRTIKIDEHIEADSEEDAQDIAVKQAERSVKMGYDWDLIDIEEGLTISTPKLSEEQRIIQERQHAADVMAKYSRPLFDLD
jgi:hypothetical protein